MTIEFKIEATVAVSPYQAAGYNQLSATGHARTAISRATRSRWGQDACATTHPVRVPSVFCIWLSTHSYDGLPIGIPNRSDRSSGRVRTNERTATNGGRWRFSQQPSCPKFPRSCPRAQIVVVAHGRRSVRTPLHYATGPEPRTTLVQAAP